MKMPKTITLELLKEEKVVHYPNLKTVLLVEKVLQKQDRLITRTQLKQKLPVKVMHQTLNVILKYLEDRGMIVDSRKGILWTYNPSKKLQDAIKRGREI